MVYGLTNSEIDFFMQLNAPDRVQDYLDVTEYNNCENGYVCKPPAGLFQNRTAHCFEAALFAAAALRMNGLPPYVIDLRGIDGDDHVIAPFVRKGLIGAIAHSKYHTLEWRDPIFRNIRELVLSYFPVYFEDYGTEKTLLGFTQMIDLSQFDHMYWMVNGQHLETLGEEISKFPYEKLYDPNVCRPRPASRGLADSVIK